MTPFQALLAWLYARLLRLYPEAFYAQFADEMLDTFRQRLAHEPRVLMTGLSEFGGLLAAALREHQHRYDPRQPIGYRRAFMLLLPALVGCAILLFRPIHVLYLSTTVWVVLGGVAGLLLAAGWLTERGVTLLALPILGVLVSIALYLLFSPRLFGSDFPLWLKTGGYFLLLLLAFAGLTHLRRLRLRAWLPYLAALPLVGIGFGLVIIHLNGEWGLPGAELMRKYVFGALIPAGTWALPVSACLLLAPRFGAKAAWLLLGVLMFDLIGLAGGLPNDPAQRFMAMGFVVWVLLVMPLNGLRWQRSRAQVVSTLALVACAYGAFFAAQALSEGLDATFMLYRLNELAQTLIVFALVMRVCARLQRPAFQPVAEAARGYNSGR